MKKILILALQLILILNCFPTIINASGTAVEITAEAPADIYGNNFFKDNPPSFTISVKNTGSEEFLGAVSYNVTKKDGTVVIENTAVKNITVAAGETESLELNVKTYYGRLNLNITVGETVKTVPYTMSNNEVTNPSNKMFGVSSHIGKNRGDIDKTFALLKGAGIGAIRDELILWQAVETTKGKHNFTEEMDRRLDLLDKYDLFYIHLWANGNSKIYPDPNTGQGANVTGDEYLFPVDAEGLNGLSTFMKKLTNFADGRIDVIEAWNEPHNFSGSYKEDYSKMAGYHKAVYNGVSSSAKKKPVVAGISEDITGIKTLKAAKNISAQLNGEKAFDAVTLHPYNNLYEWNDNPPEQGVTESIITETKTQLGANSDVKFYFTESGWSDYTLGYDREKQAAYNIRHQAKIASEDLVETSCIHTIFDISDRTDIEANFGMLESYNSELAEVPYLGKESYPAYAYYNNLMADAEFVGMKATGNDNVLAYQFKDRLGRDVFMITSVDNTTEDVNLDFDADSITVSDMYGNETKQNSGVLNTTVSGIPMYVIKDNISSVLGVVSGEANSGEKLVLKVYNDGFTPDNTTSENVASALYYTEQKSAAYTGSFEFSFPLDENFKSKNAYIYVDGEESPREYKIEQWDEFALSYETKPESSHDCFAYLSGQSSKENIELVSAGFADNRLSDLMIAEQEETVNNLILKKVKLNPDSQSLKLMIVSDFYNLKPLIPDVTWQ